LLAAGLTAAFILLLSPIARSIDLVAYPGGRGIRQHSQPVPLIGGISIILAVCLCALLSPLNLSHFRVLFFSVIILTFVCVLDDHRDIKASIKFLFQILVVGILINFDDVTVLYLGELFPDQGRQGLGLLAVPFTLIAIIGVMNAVNMIDGHDGLAGSCALITLCAILLLPGLMVQPELTQLYQHLAPDILVEAISTLQVRLEIGYAIRSFILFVLAPLFIFIIFNVISSPIFGQNRQVYLGDVGSVFLGLLIAYTLIKLSDSSFYYYQSDAGYDYYRPGTFIPANAASWFVGLPLVDMIAVLFIRMFRKDSLVIGDRRHLHYLLVDRGWSRLSVLVTLILVHLLLVLIGFMSIVRNWPDFILFWGFVGTIIAHIAVCSILSRQPTKSSTI
jgi:UDP-GlcNAc:undecaprenyl-phosphate GlcNAc-1-phosphate transferase